MSRLWKIYAIVGRDPFIVVEFIGSLSILLMGLFFLSPLFEPGPNSALLPYLTTPLVFKGVGLSYVASGAFGLYATKNQKWRNVSTHALYTVAVFTALLRVLTVGWIPVVWVWPLLLGLIYVIDNVNIRWKQSSG